MPDALGEKLQDATIPDSGSRRDEVIRLALDGDAQPKPAAVGRTRQRKWFLRAPVAIAAILAFVIAAAFTPPGRAIADDIAGLVGIGDDPTLDPSEDQDLVARGRAVVVATGTVPGTDQSIEISAYGSQDVPAQGNLEPGPGPPVHDLGREKELSCLNVDLPGLESQAQVRFNSTCIDRPVEQPLDFNSSTDNLDRLGDEARFTVGGTLSAEVSRVEVTYEDAAGQRVDAPVVLATLDQGVAEETGAPLTFGLFQAFLPDDGSPESGVVAASHPAVNSVEVTAFDSSGEEVASADGRKFQPRPPSPEAIRNARLIERRCARGWNSGVCEAVGVEP